MANIKYPMPDFIKVFLLIILIGLLSYILSGCSTTRKNDKAFGRVLSDSYLFDRMGKRWEEVNPCIKIEVTKGKDSVKIDTVFNSDVVFGEDSVKIDSFESVVTKTIIKKVPVYISKTTFRVDTVPDLRRINLLQKDISFRDGKIVQQAIALKEEKKEKRNWMWWFFGLLSLNAVICFLKLRKGFIK